MNIFTMDSYKKIIQSTLPRGGSKKLADYLGVHPTYISQVLTGDREFSEEQILQVCEFLSFKKMETRYLLCLVQIERAGSKKLKDHYLEIKKSIQASSLQISKRIDKDRQLTDFEKAIFYSSWIYSAVHIMTTLDKKPRIEDIMEKYNLTMSKAREILSFLIDIEMVIEKNGTYHAGAIFTHLEKSSPLVIKHHTNWRLKAIQAAEELTDSELMYSINVSLSKKDFENLREEMAKLIQSFLKVVKDSPAEDVAQFNLDFFWIKK